MSPEVATRREENNHARSPGLPEPPETMEAISGRRDYTPAPLVIHFSSRDERLANIVKLLALIVSECEVIQRIFVRMRSLFGSYSSWREGVPRPEPFDISPAIHAEGRAKGGLQRGVVILICDSVSHVHTLDSSRAPWFTGRAR